MRDILHQIDQWLAAEKEIAVATIINVHGSALRGLGAKMIFTEDGQIAGSVSGGCVENAVFQAGLEVLRSGEPRCIQFDKAEETDWNTVGLACGGKIDVFLNRLDENVYYQIRELLLQGKSLTTATIIRGPSEMLGKQQIITEELVRTDPVSVMLRENPSHSHLCLNEYNQCVTLQLLTPDQTSVDVFIEPIESQPTLIVIGGSHIAIGLISLANTLGFRTIVIDPRRVFNSDERFPFADQLIQAWPEDALRQIGVDSNTAIVTLSHDPKIDDPAIEIALRSDAFYIGVLGSQMTQLGKKKKFASMGFPIQELSRIHGPVGLNLGGTKPVEIALEIISEIVAAQHGVTVTASP